MIGSQEAWDRLYGLGVPVYWTVAFWTDDRWVEKRRPKPKSKYPPRWNAWVRRCAAQGENRFTEAPWNVVHDKHDEDTFDVDLEVKFEKLMVKARTVDALIRRMTYNMRTRWAQLEPGSKVFEDRKTGRQYRVGHFGPIFTPGRDPEPKKAFVYATRPVR